MSVLATHRLSGLKHEFGKVPQESIILLKGIGVEGDIHSGKEDQHEYHRKVDARAGKKVRNNLRQVHLIQSELYDGEDFHGLNGERVRPGQLGENITTIGIDLMALGKGAKLHFVDESSIEQTVKEIEERGQTWFQLARHSDGLHGSLIVLAVLMFPTLRSGNILLPILAIGLATVVAFVRYKQADPPTTAVVKLTGLRIPCMKIDKFRDGLKAKCQIVPNPNPGKQPGMKGGLMGVVERGGVVRPGMKIVVEKAKVWEKLPTV